MPRKPVPVPQWRNRVVELRYVSPRDIADHPMQWREHPDLQRSALTGILEEVGIAGALLAYVSPSTGQLTAVDGHLRKSLGEAPWPTLILDVTDEEAALLLSTTDPLAALAESNKDQLAALLHQVQSGDAAVQQMLSELAQREGVVPPEWNGNGVETAPSEDVEPQIDRAEELRKEWGVEVGQLWVLGEHRVVCGDCTDAAVMQRVFGGEKPAAVVTDPPYGVGVEYASFQDSVPNALDLIGKFMPLLQGLAPIALTPGIPAMWSYPRPSWVMAWIHPAPTSSGPWGFVGLNPILVYGADPYLKRGLGRRPDHIVMAADREGMEGHPTPKPLKVWSWLVERLTVEPGALCYDPFLGSGTTLIACEQLGRRCFGCEIDPGYVAVILQRYVDTGGQHPVLLETKGF